MTDEERSAWIMERLGISTISGRLSSPSGIHRVKQAMIERGFGFNCVCLPERKENKWRCLFGKTGDSSRLCSWGETEEKVILDAAYYALQEL